MREAISILPTFHPDFSYSRGERLPPTDNFPSARPASCCLCVTERWGVVVGGLPKAQTVKDSQNSVIVSSSHSQAWQLSTLVNGYTSPTGLCPGGSSLAQLQCKRQGHSSAFTSVAPGTNQAGRTQRAPLPKVLG